MRGRLVQRIQRGWYRPGQPAPWLRAIASLYGAIGSLRTTLYRRGLLRATRMPVPVIVIGNLTVGGAGKTPLTIAIADWLRASGYRPGVVSRGYGRRGKSPRLVRAEDVAEDVGDEPLLIAASGVPVAVAPRRVDAARLLLEGPGVDVLLADDGLQHYALARDVEILVIDGRRRFGNGALLPAGPMREPVDRGRDCDLVVVNGGTAAPGEHAMQLAVRQAVPLRVGPPEPLERFAGRRVHAVAGIGDPARFFDALRGFGIEVHEHAFPDHHPYTAGDLEFAEALPVLMTEKDAVKCRGFAGPGWYSVPASAELPRQFFEALRSRLEAARARQGGA
jgi:tetraacyldisaccharide 4'-kinase